MEQLMELTAWGMEKPTAYGLFHLVFLIGGLAYCAIFAYLLRKSSEKTSNIILFSVGAFLLISEVYKQLFYTYYIGGGEYQWWIFPFQLCSVPMYLCLIVPFFKPGKIKNALYTFLASYNLLGGFLALFEPSGLSHEYVTLTLHAFVWHLLLAFVGFFLIASGKVGYKLKDFASSIVIFLILCGVAETINIVCTLVFGATDINMFYISPFRTNPIIIFKQIHQATNWVVNLILYPSMITLGAFLFFLAAMGIKRMPKKKVKIDFSRIKYRNCISRDSIE